MLDESSGVMSEQENVINEEARETVDPQAKDTTGAQNGQPQTEGEQTDANDGNPPQTEGTPSVTAQLEAELAAANARVDQLMDQMQRTAAEFQNARKRQERQVQESIDRATEGLLRRLLPVLDDFELAFNNVPETLQGEEAAWTEGFERIYQKLSTLVSDEGITAIEKEGPFDPSRHEAVTNEPNDNVESGHIIETLRTGYEYKDRVLRPALVRVAQ